MTHDTHDISDKMPSMLTEGHKKGFGYYSASHKASTATEYKAAGSGMFLIGIVSAYISTLNSISMDEKEDATMLSIGFMCFMQLMYLLQVALAKEFYLQGACYISASTPELDSSIKCEYHNAHFVYMLRYLLRYLYSLRRRHHPCCHPFLGLCVNFQQKEGTS